MDAALADTLARLPRPPADTTDWADAIAAAAGKRVQGPAAAFFARKLGQNNHADRIARAAAGARIVAEANNAETVWLSAEVVTPAGARVRVACSRPAAFLRVLLAWEAAVAAAKLREEAAKIKLAPNTAVELGGMALHAAAALRAALPWRHGESVMPAQLGDDFQARVRAAAHIAQYAGLAQRAPDATMALTQSRLAVGVLQLIVKDTAGRAPAAHRWAAEQLRAETAHAWAIHRCDPRGGDDAVTDSQLYANLTGLCKGLGRAAVPRSAAVALRALEAIVGARTADVAAKVAAVADAAQLLAPLDLPQVAKGYSCLVAGAGQAAACPSQALCLLPQAPVFSVI